MSLSIIKLKTPDQCELTVQTILHSSDAPYVLLIHGIGATGNMWLGNGEKYRLPYFLKRNGYNVCMLSLRNRWNFTSNQWDLDHYVEFDIPTVMEYLLQKGNAKKIHIVGHSLGGLLAK